MTRLWFKSQWLPHKKNTACLSRECRNVLKVIFLSLNITWGWCSWLACSLIKLEVSGSITTLEHNFVFVPLLSSTQWQVGPLWQREKVIWGGARRILWLVKMDGYRAIRSRSDRIITSSRIRCSLGACFLRFALFTLSLQYIYIYTLEPQCL